MAKKIIDFEDEVPEVVTPVVTESAEIELDRDLASWWIELYSNGRDITENVLGNLVNSTIGDVEGAFLNYSYQQINLNNNRTGHSFRVEIGDYDAAIRVLALNKQYIAGASLNVHSDAYKERQRAQRNAERNGGDRRGNDRGFERGSDRRSDRPSMGFSRGDSDFSRGGDRDRPSMGFSRGESEFSRGGDRRSDRSTGSSSMGFSRGDSDFSQNSRPARTFGRSVGSTESSGNPFSRSEITLNNSSSWKTGTRGPKKMDAEASIQASQKALITRKFVPEAVKADRFGKLRID